MLRPLNTRTMYASSTSARSHFEVRSLTSVCLQPQLTAVIDAIRQLHAEGLFTVAEASAIGDEFVKFSQAAQDQKKAKSSIRSADSGTTSAPTSAGGELPTIGRDDVSSVLHKIGITDEALCQRIFEAWDYDRCGAVSLTEFVHALVLVLRGTATDKLNLVFRIADIDCDGCIGRGDLRRFLSDLHTFAATGKAKNKHAQAIDAEVGNG